jgi:hypothetical protein
MSGPCLAINIDDIFPLQMLNLKPETVEIHNKTALTDGFSFIFPLDNPHQYYIAHRRMDIDYFRDGGIADKCIFENQSLT